MKKINWKERQGITYSTNPDFAYQTDAADAPSTLPASQQPLRLRLDKRHRGGKTVTLITGFVGTEADLQALGKTLKTRCGTGGSAKDAEIIIQGDFRQKALAILLEAGYAASRII